MLGTSIELVHSETFESLGYIRRVKLNGNAGIKTLVLKNKKHRLSEIIGQSNFMRGHGPMENYTHLQLGAIFMIPYI